MIALRALGILCGGVLLVAMVGCPSPEDDNGPSGSGASGAGTPTSTSTSTGAAGNGGNGGTGGTPLTCSETYTDIDETNCSLLSQDCPAGSWCNVNTAGTASECVPDTGGLKGKGEDCGTLSECRAGLQCSNDKCTPVCCPASDEPCEGGSCDIQLNFGGGYVMVCSYLQACTLFMDECPEGYDCHISDPDAGLAVCDEAAPNQAPEGGACMFRNDCGESQLCNFNPPDNGVCRHLCDTTIATTADPGLGGCLPDRTCNAANVPTFPNLGICLP